MPASMFWLFILYLTNGESSSQKKKIVKYYDQISKKWELFFMGVVLGLQNVCKHYPK